MSTGRAPARSIAAIVATAVWDGAITACPGPMPADPQGQFDRVGAAGDADGLSDA